MGYVIRPASWESGPLQRPRCSFAARNWGTCCSFQVICQYLHLDLELSWLCPSRWKKLVIPDPLQRSWCSFAKRNFDTRCWRSFQVICQYTSWSRAKLMCPSAWKYPYSQVLYRGLGEALSQEIWVLGCSTSFHGHRLIYILILQKRKVFRLARKMLASMALSQFQL